MEFNNTIATHVIPNITTSILSLLNYNWANYQLSFYTWLAYNSDEDFAYIFISEFKKYFQVFFTPETERILSYYSQNLSIAIGCFYELNQNIEPLTIFIKKMINLQFKGLDKYQLFMDTI